MKQLLTIALTLGALTGTQALAAGAAAGTTISNVGSFQYSDDAGTTQTLETTPVNLTVQQVYNPSVTPDGTVTTPGQTSYAAPGTTGVLTYTLTNTGNGLDTFTLTNGGNGAPSHADVTYIRDDGDGVYEPGIDQVITGGTVTLGADDSATIFILKPIDAAAPANQNTYINLNATSTGDTTRSDTNNVGLISSQQVISFTLANDNALQVTSPGTVQATHTLTNTGNADLDPATLVASSTVTDPGAILSSVSYQITAPDGTTGPVSSTLQGAFAGLPSLAAGEAYTIQVTYTATPGNDAGDSATTTLSIYSNVTDTAATDNRAESTQALSDTDTVTIIKGEAALNKTVMSCGLDATCATPTSATTARPGEYLLYTVTVTNTGDAALKFPTLRDYVPSDTIFSSLSGTLSSGGDVLYSTNRTSWNTAAPSSYTNGTAAAGPFLYVGVDSNNDNTVTSADGLIPGATLTMYLIVKVRDTGPTAVTAPVLPQM